MEKILKILVASSAVVLGAMALGVFVAPYLPASLSKEVSVIDQAIVDKVKKSIVAMETTYGIRSGLVLNEHGLTIALSSVLDKKNVIPGYVQGDHVGAQNLHRGTDNLGMLRINKSNIQGVSLADEANIKTGQTVFTMNVASFNPDEWTVTTGTITQITIDTFVTDITGAPALDSSPLFNTAGELVGTIYTDENNRAIAIPASKVKLLMSYFQ